MSFIWWANVMGIIFSGTGAFILAYDVFSFKPKYQPGSYGYLMEKPKHEKKNLNLIKVALILIPLGAALQLLAVFLDL